MREIPMRYIKTNQAGIVVFALLSVLLAQAWPLVVLLAVQVAGLATRGRLNPFVALARRAFAGNPGKETQAEELQRFNNILAVLFLTAAVVSFAFGWATAGLVFTLMLIVAAGAALLGYCIGCTIYYQYKRLSARSR